MKKIICHFLFLLTLCDAIYGKSLTSAIDQQAKEQVPWTIDSKVLLEGVDKAYDTNNPDGTHSMVYRLFKGVTSEGYLIQDYYEKNDTKRTEPFLITDKYSVESAFAMVLPDTLEGPFVYYAPDGSKYSEGLYLRGNMQGIWQFWKNNKKSMQVSFDKGELKGKWQIWHNNGAKWVEGEFASNTIKTGLWRVWGDKNNRRLQGKYVDNLAQGVWQAWHNNGKLAWKGNYLNGVRHGKWVWWHNNGIKSREIIYDEGAQVTLEAQWNNQAKGIAQLKQPINRAKTQAQTKLPANSFFEGYTGPIVFDEGIDSFPSPKVRYKSYRKYWGVTDSNLCVVQDFYNRASLSTDEEVNKASIENNRFFYDGYAYFYSPLNALSQLPSILGSDLDSHESDIKMSDPFTMPCDDLISYMQEEEYTDDMPTIPYNYTYIGWYPSGKKAMEGLMVNGMKQGIWTTWHDNGTKASQGQYIDSQKQGEWLHWYSSGNKKNSQYYERDNKQGEFVAWHENGKLWQKGFYEQNQRAKLWSQWSDKGEKQWEGSYQANQRTEPWQHWDAKGKLIADSYQPIIDTVATAEQQHLKMGELLVRASPYYVGNSLTRDDWIPHCSMVSRRFLGITVDNYYLVQEFGECSGRNAVNGVAITEPFVLTNYQALYDVRSLWRFDRAIDGRYTVYNINNSKQKQWQVYYKKGQAEGLWTKWDSNGKKIQEGRYSDGKVEGVWTRWDSSGQKVEESPFKQGFLQGIYKKWYPNGELAEQGEYKNSSKIGLWQGWYQNGQMRSEAFYDAQGRKQGAQTDWYKNGNKESLNEYQNDKPHGRWDVWYENGQKRFERTVYNGKYQGLYTSWHSNGQIERQITLKNDKPVNGTWITYDYNGHLTGFGYYDKDDKPDGIQILLHNNLKLREVKLYIHGELNGLAMEWYDNGQLKSYLTYCNNHLQGYVFFWFANGQMRDEMTYDNGQINGRLQSWYENGKPRLRFYYENGNQVDKPDSFFNGNN